MVKPFLGDLTLEEALMYKKIFIVDLSVTEDSGENTKTPVRSEYFRILHRSNVITTSELSLKMRKKCIFQISDYVTLD